MFPSPPNNLSYLFNSIALASTSNSKFMLRNLSLPQHAHRIDCLKILIFAIFAIFFFFFYYVFIYTPDFSSME